jgi:hypothetical protein
MFFDNPVAAFTNVGRALKPGGRTVFTCWQELLCMTGSWFRRAQLSSMCPCPTSVSFGGPGPFSFADAGRLHQVLGDAGFLDIAVEEVVRPVRLGDSVDDAFHYVQHSEIADVS